MDLQPLFDAGKAVERAKAGFDYDHVAKVVNHCATYETMVALIEQGHGVPQMQSWIKRPDEPLLYKVTIQVGNIVFWRGFPLEQAEELRAVAMAVAVKEA